MIERASSASAFEKRYGFCRALKVGGRIEVAGTAPIPQDGSAPPGSAYEQMHLCARIALDAIEGLGGGIPIRTRMFIVDPGDQDEIGRAHREAFGVEPPVATMVVVGGLLDPRWKVEIEVEAIC